MTKEISKITQSELISLLGEGMSRIEEVSFTRAGTENQFTKITVTLEDNTKAHAVVPLLPCLSDFFNSVFKLFVENEKKLRIEMSSQEKEDKENYSDK